MTDLSKLVGLTTATISRRGDVALKRTIEDGDFAPLNIRVTEENQRSASQES